MRKIRLLIPSRAPILNPSSFLSSTSGSELVTPPDIEPNYGTFLDTEKNTDNIRKVNICCTTKHYLHSRGEPPSIHYMFEIDAVSEQQHRL
ncbi:hypothetical protein E4T56_gene13530 [Termitomyces sp. T112]|nr:hypothetical protein E4T56_gene13530 [Termitomyces sp. T112]